MTVDLKKVFVDSKNFINVHEVEVPEEMNQRFKSGVPFFDEMFGEGMVPGTITLFTGASGGGKTTLCLQMINGFAAQNIVCCLNSSEEHVSQIKKTADRLGLENPFLVSNSNNIDNVLRQARETEVKVLVIDSLQTMGSGKNGPGGTKVMKDVTSKLIQYCKETFTIGILIGHVTKGGGAAGPNTIKHMLDAHLHLGLCTNVNCLTCEIGTRTLNMEKNRYSFSNAPKYLFMFPEGFREVPR